MEHIRPQLSDRMKEGDASSYQEACLYVEGNIRQISQPVMKNSKLENFGQAAVNTPCPGVMLS